MFVKFKYEVGFAGMQDEEIVELPNEDCSVEYLDEYAWQGALNHAESYGYYPYPEDASEDDEDEDGDQYSDNIEGTWEFVTEENND